MVATANVEVRAKWKGQDVQRGIRQVDRDAARLKETMRRMTPILRSVGAMMGLAVGTQMVKQVVGMADAWKGYQNRIRLFTGSAKELAEVQDRLFKISQRTFTSMGSTVDLYQKFSMSNDELKLSQEELGGVIETVNQTLLISGGSAESANAAVIQLGQGLASGTLRGEELNSVLEQAPRLARALAAGMNIPIGKLRELGAAGEITGKKVIEALQSQSGIVAAEAATMEATVSMAWVRLTDSAGNYLDKLNKVAGATSAIASAMQTMAEAINALPDPEEIKQGFQTPAGRMATAATAGMVAGAPFGGPVGAAVGGTAGAAAQLLILIDEYFAEERKKLTTSQRLDPSSRFFTGTIQPTREQLMFKPSDQPVAPVPPEPPPPGPYQGFGRQRAANLLPVTGGRPDFRTMEDRFRESTMPRFRPFSIMERPTFEGTEQDRGAQRDLRARFEAAQVDTDLPGSERRLLEIRQDLEMQNTKATIPGAKLWIAALGEVHRAELQQHDAAVQRKKDLVDGRKAIKDQAEAERDRIRILSGSVKVLGRFNQDLGKFAEGVARIATGDKIGGAFVLINLGLDKFLGQTDDYAQRMREINASVASSVRGLEGMGDQSISREVTQLQFTAVAPMLELFDSLRHSGGRTQIENLRDFVEMMVRVQEEAAAGVPQSMRMFEILENFFPDAEVIKHVSQNAQSTVHTGTVDLFSALGDDFQEQINLAFGDEATFADVARRMFGVRDAMLDLRDAAEELTGPLERAVTTTFDVQEMALRRQAQGEFAAAGGNVGAQAVVMADLKKSIDELARSEREQLRLALNAPAGDAVAPAGETGTNGAGGTGSAGEAETTVTVTTGPALVIDDFADAIDISNAAKILVGWDDVINQTNLNSNPLTQYDWPDAIAIQDKYGQSDTRPFNGWEDVIDTSFLTPLTQYDWPQAIAIMSKYGHSDTRPFNGWEDVIDTSFLTPLTEYDWPDAIAIQDQYGRSSKKSFNGWEDVIDKLYLSSPITEYDWTHAIAIGDKYGVSEKHRPFSGWHDVIDKDASWVSKPIAKYDWTHAIAIMNKYGVSEKHRPLTGWHDVIDKEASWKDKPIAKYDWTHAIAIQNKYGVSDEHRSLTGWQDVIDMSVLDEPSARIERDWYQAIKMRHWWHGWQHRHKMSGDWSRLVDLSSVAPIQIAYSDIITFTGSKKKISLADVIDLSELEGIVTGIVSRNSNNRVVDPADMTPEERWRYNRGGWG